VTGANDGVGFPVAEATLASDDRRPLLNADAVGDLAPPDVAAIPLPLFLLTAQMAMQRTAMPLVSIDVEIDAFRTDRSLALELQATGDLFGTPLLPQE